MVYCNISLFFVIRVNVRFVGGVRLPGEQKKNRERVRMSNIIEFFIFYKKKVIKKCSNGDHGKRI